MILLYGWMPNLRYYSPFCLSKTVHLKMQLTAHPTVESKLFNKSFTGNTLGEILQMRLKTHWE